MKGKKIVLVLIIVLLIALLAIAGAYVYIATDLFKSPEKQFEKYLLNEMDQIKELKFEPFDQILQRLSEDNSKIDINLSIDSDKMMDSSFDADEEDVDEYDSEESSITDVKITVESDVKNQGLALVVDAETNKEYLLKGVLALTKDKFSLQVDDLGEKAFTLKNKNLDKTLKKFGIENDAIPSSIEILSENETFAEKKEKANALITKYYNNFSQKLADKEFEVNNVDTTVDGTMLNAKQIKMFVKAKTFCNAAIDCYEALVNDEEFTSFINQKLDSKTLKEIEEKIKDLREEVKNNIKDEDLVEISLYVADSRTVKTEVNLTINEENNRFELVVDNGKIALFEYEKGKDKPYGYYRMSNTYDGTQGVLEIVSKESDMAKEQAYKITTKKTSDNQYKSTYDLGKDVKGITLSTVYKLGEKVELNKLVDDEIILNDLSEEKIATLLTETTEYIPEFYEEHPNSLIGMLYQFVFSFSSYSYDSGVETFQDSENDDYFISNSSNLNETTKPMSFNVNIKDEIEEAVKKGLNKCLSDYKIELSDNAEANLGDFLNLDKLEDNINNSDYELELVNGNTIKVTINGDVYYGYMNIDANDLVVTSVEVVTEDEYNN